MIQDTLQHVTWNPYADLIAITERHQAAKMAEDEYNRAAQARWHARKVAAQQAKFRGWRIYKAGGMLCDCATSDEAAGWQASREADAAMRRCEVRG